MPTIGADGAAEAVLSGGCMCGAVRYRLFAEPTDAGWCHCRTCQLSSGSPALAFASIPIDKMRLESGEDSIGVYASSEEAERWYCRDCGTPLWVQLRKDAKARDFHLATLDDPAAVTPEFHIYVSSHIPWAEPAAGLKRYERLRG